MSKLRLKVNELLLEIKSGDNSKLEELVYLTYNQLMIVSLKYTYNKNYYEDILMNAYCNILKYIDTFNAFKDGFNWMCKIVQNEARKQNIVSGKYVLLDDLSINGIEEYPDNILGIINKNILLEQINHFTYKDKLILYYRFYLDWTMNKIASKMHCTKGYINKRLKILLKRIKGNFDL